MKWSVWLFSLAVVASAAERPLDKISPRDVDDMLDQLTKRFESAIPNVTQAALDLFDRHLGGLGIPSYTIPQYSLFGTPLRRVSLTAVRTSFLYGSPVGGGPSYPTGLLGLAKVAQDSLSILQDLLPRLAGSRVDLIKASFNSSKYNGLKTLSDYEKLYDNEWKLSMPHGPDPGVLTNYTKDLLFSMQRLSNSPYQIRRLDPRSDALPFPVDRAAVFHICGGSSLGQLFQYGRLFYADYRDQKDLEPVDGRYTANCDAYFCIDSRSGDFLPLAIRTNVGANLIYTPLDGPGEWLLAKMMLNVNDFWFAQWNHLAFTHETVHIIWMAAMRSLSQHHPVFAILNRLMFQVFSIQILAEVILFTPGLAVDMNFAYSGQSAKNYSSEQYRNGYGNFQSNYFHTDLQRRGLINSTRGPPLKNFPFFEDANTIHSSIRKFFTSFVQSYYSSDSVLADDHEIQDWVKECNGPANVFDFPSAINDRRTLVDVLTQLAHLASAAHHTVNTNELLQVSSTLPFCPAALYKPLPTAKNASLNPVEWLPPLSQVFSQLSIGSLFARPSFEGSNRTIIHMFDDPVMLAKMNPTTRAANLVFMSEMENFSRDVMGNRGFDADGLSQGMPFVWKALDPNVAPYSVST
ncbi:lipoxygenase [Podospora aff. communis PSN243]|uniref:Manganese lipoxygenase n=1 Tax=Podospora aff. communis PSN243 TaxID=3040156 RepID=A0AAV9GEB9_9PEZI|nr:lipoxygenase [Podospora aff. communis PSN243]